MPSLRQQVVAGEAFVATMAPLVVSPHALFTTWLVGVCSRQVDQEYFQALYQDILRLVSDYIVPVHELHQPDIVSLCANGCAEAMLELGDRYTWGSFQHGVPCDFVNAAGWLKKSAMLDNANAHATLAVLFWKGNGVPKDRVAASFHAQESFRLGLVDQIRKGDGSSACRALSIQRLGIDLGPNRTIRDMLQLEERGRDVLASMPGIRELGFGAFGHWKMQCVCMSAIASLHEEHMPGYTAASSEHPPCSPSARPTGQRRTGLSFPTKALAIAALHDLSEHNFARAQFELGLAYSVGNGVPQNHMLAVAQLEKAAQQSEPGAIFVLARYFETGLGGIPVNLERAECCKLAVLKTGIDFTDLVLHAK